jgi:hypothetical protein
MHPPRQPTRTQQVINRPELDIIERHPKGTRKSIVLILALFAFGWALSNALGSGSFNANWFAGRNFAVEDVQLRPQTVSGKTFWTVSGKLINQTKSTESAPDLQVKLVRPDGSVAAEDVIALRAQIVPGQSAIAFRGRIMTGPGEAVNAEIDFLKPQPAGEGKNL